MKLQITITGTGALALLGVYTISIGIIAIAFRQKQNNAKENCKSIEGESAEQKGLKIQNNSTAKTRNEKPNRIPETEFKGRKHTFLEKVEVRAETNTIDSGKTTITKAAILPPPPPPPPPPLPNETNIKIFVKIPKGPIKLVARDENSKFFQETSKVKAEKFAIPTIDSSPQSTKNNLLNKAGSVGDKNSAVIDGIKEGILKKLGLSAQEIYKAITSFDFKNLTTEQIKILIDNAPKDQNTNHGTNEYKETLSCLNVLDMIEDVKQILESMLFFKSFLSEYKCLEDQFAKMKIVCDSLTKSAKQSKFRQLFRNIIEFAGTASGDSQYLKNGFEIGTLPTLWETKPFNGKSALNVFVENLVRNNSETLLFYEDFKYLDGFSCPDPVTVGKDLGNLTDRLNLGKILIDKLSNCQADNNISHILKSIPGMKNKIEILEDKWNNLTTKSYNDCLRAHGQKESEKILKFLLVEVLQSFIKEFEREKKTHEIQSKKIPQIVTMAESDSPKENNISKYRTTKRFPLKSINSN